MNISLIGMMGSGKTTVSKQLALYLPDFSFVDTDTLIERNEGISVSEIFEKKGEEYFRQVESRVLDNVLQNSNQIISTGGGIVKSLDNLALLKQKSLVFYLQASADTLYERVKNDNSRPLLRDDDIKRKIEILSKQRVSLYEQAHYIVNTDNRRIDSVVKEILEKLSVYAENRR